MGYFNSIACIELFCSITLNLEHCDKKVKIWLLNRTMFFPTLNGKSLASLRLKTSEFCRKW